jgi:hypothetical protein
MAVRGEGVVTGTICGCGTTFSADPLGESFSKIDVDRAMYGLDATVPRKCRKTPALTRADSLSCLS